MRKHHTHGSSARTLVRAHRRLAAGLLAGVAAGGTFVPLPGQALAATVPATPPPVWVVGAHGGVTSPSSSPVYGTAPRPVPATPFYASATTRDGHGYWTADAAGRVLAHGDARGYGPGSVSGDRGIVAIAPTPKGLGYWLVSSQGRVYRYGNAGGYGSLRSPGDHPVVGMAVTPRGFGYWLVDSAGDVYHFGNASTYGSLAGRRLARPIVGMSPSSDGRGYWLLGAGGQVYRFGDAAYYGSFDAAAHHATLRAVVGDRSGGYWLVGSAGRLHPFGPRAGRPPVIVAAVAAPLAPAGAPADKALAFARAQLGKPYVWGGTGPRGYDCSGLTQASWRAAGLALPRTAAEQYAGVHVPVARATPGDLIFWSSSSRPSGIYHVGLYAGDHRMIDAAHPGTDVRVEAVWPGVFPVATQP